MTADEYNPDPAASTPPTPEQEEKVELLKSFRDEQRERMLARQFYRLLFAMHIKAADLCEILKYLPEDTYIIGADYIPENGASQLMLSSTHFPITEIQSKVPELICEVTVDKNRKIENVKFFTWGKNFEQVQVGPWQGK